MGGIYMFIPYCKYEEVGFVGVDEQDNGVIVTLPAHKIKCKLTDAQYKKIGYIGGERRWQVDKSYRKLGKAIIDHFRGVSDNLGEIERLEWVEKKPKRRG
jgi:hypothetical protein